jgi:DNA-binding transcriptional regulator YiaG
MKGAEVKRLRKRLGMTQTEFAQLLGVHRVTATRWEIGATKVQAPMAKLIRMIGQSKNITRRRSTK